MDDEINGWNIGRAGRTWTGPEGLEKLNRLPGRLEIVRGKLCLDEAQRLTLLAGLLENVGLDEVVKLGQLQDWQEAIAARANVSPEPPAPGPSPTPASHWNCRVIEFPSDEETWFAVHEVYYEHGVPVAYSESPAAAGWTNDDGPEAALHRLEKFSDALKKPFLKRADFENARAKAALLNKLCLMIEQSGGEADMAALSAWLNAWLGEPLPELNGATPAQALYSGDGRRQVETLLERTRGGLCA
ncbi:UNVERIFIED_ORG: MbcA/ParS/Xre antitoxin family protein (plasmid) [Shinella sp. XGS7]|nr:MbcA/ParS/Xre antitoxin family protein [Shinella sp. XGS7]